MKKYIRNKYEAYNNARLREWVREMVVEGYSIDQMIAAVRKHYIITKMTLRELVQDLE